MHRTFAALVTALLLAVSGFSIIASGDADDPSPTATRRGGFEWDHPKGTP